MDPSLPQVPGYALRQLLGEGPLGEAFLGNDEKTGREVVIKVLTEPVSDETLGILRGWVSHGQGLSLTRVARFLDASAHGATIHLVREAAPGDPLRAFITPMEGVHAEQIIPLSQAIASALAELHGQGLVHGNLKPENIFITENGSVTLTDTALDRTDSTAVDLQKLSAILQEMLSGEAPRTEEDAKKKKRNDSRRIRADIGMPVRLPLIKLIAALKTDDPEKRPTIDDVLARLDEIAQLPLAPEAIPEEGASEAQVAAVAPVAPAPEAAPSSTVPPEATTPPVEKPPEGTAAPPSPLGVKAEPPKSGENSAEENFLGRLAIATMNIARFTVPAAIVAYGLYYMYETKVRSAQLMSQLKSEAADGTAKRAFDELRELRFGPPEDFETGLRAALQHPDPALRKAAFDELERNGKADAAIRDLVAIDEPSKRVPLDQLGAYLEKLDRGRTTTTLVDMLKQTNTSQGTGLRVYILSVLLRHFEKETEVTRVVERRLEGERPEHQEMLRILRSVKPARSFIDGLVPTLTRVCEKLDHTEGQAARAYLGSQLRDPAFAAHHLPTLMDSADLDLCITALDIAATSPIARPDLLPALDRAEERWASTARYLRQARAGDDPAGAGSSGGFRGVIVVTSGSPSADSLAPGGSSMRLRTSAGRELDARQMLERLEKARAQLTRVG